MDELTVYTEDRVALTDYAAEELTKIVIAKKELKKREDELRAALLEEMTEHDILSIEHDVYGVKVTKVESTDQESLDSKALKKDKPDIYDQYVKITTKQAYLKITVK